MSKEKDANAVSLLGSPEKLIAQFVSGPKKQTWVLDKITKGGPPHKQLQHTLVINRLGKLAEIIQKRTGVALKPQKGWDIITDSDEDVMPIQLPGVSIAGIADAEDTFDAMSKGPAHEILYTALLLQIVDGMILSEEIKTKK